ncbi:MAG: glucosaminidase domain-containing protein [Colwellia sp.]
MDISLSQAHNFERSRNALELTGLNEIRQQSRSTDEGEKKAALKEAAQQFEAIFMRMLLSSMRKAQDVLESDSPFNSESSKFYRDMHDQQMAIELSTNGTLGLTDLIMRQLGGDSGNFTPSSVLRSDGNLPSINRDVANDDKSLTSDTRSQNNPHNSLIEKMSANKEGLGNPFAGSYLPQSTSVNQINSTTSPFVLRATDKKVTNVNSPAESVNISPSMATPTFEQPKDFVHALVIPAQRVEQQLGVPFEVVIAQAALETGWGQKIIHDTNGDSSNNLFNIKADSRWAGEHVTKDTLEFEQGAMIKKSEPFRRYQSLTDSVDDYINFLSTSERYQDALQNVGNVEHFLHNLQDAGYATDPQYANKILGTLKTVTQLLTK